MPQVVGILHYSEALSICIYIVLYSNSISLWLATRDEMLTTVVVKLVVSFDLDACEDLDAHTVVMIYLCLVLCAWYLFVLVLLFVRMLCACTYLYVCFVLGCSISCFV
jgi:hypothetical protein